MGVGVSCDRGLHDACLRPSCSCTCHGLSYGRRMLLADPPRLRAVPRPSTEPASRTIVRDCKRCARPFGQETRQGRPFSLCTACRP